MKLAHPRFLSISLSFLFLATLIGSAQNRIAIPSYQDPGSSQWNAWIAPGSPSIGIMIVNENNGDDRSYNPEIDAAIQRARKSGIFVVGYIYTGYGKRDPAVVKKDIDAVFQNYLVDGIFFDEVPTACGATTPKLGTTYRYYQTLANYVRSRQVAGRIVILNPGTQPANDCWMSIANIVVTAESSSLQDYTQNYQDEAWFHRYSPSRFWHIVYNVSGAADFNAVLSLSRKRGAGWVYVTDGGNANPYANPPQYWNQETSQIAAQDVQAPYATYRPASQAENGNPVDPRFSIRWKAIHPSAWNILIATDQPDKTRLQPARNGVTIAADFLLQVSANGQATLLRYTGNGTTWEWKKINTSAISFLVGPDTVLAEADAAALGGAQSLRYQIQQVGGKQFTSMPEPLSLNNTAYLFDIENH